MANKNLKKQLESLFVDLENPLTPDNILELTEGSDDEKPEDLSSKPEEPLPLPKPAPSKPPLKMEPQQLRPIIETPHVHQEESKILRSKLEDSFTPSEPITPSAGPVKTEPQQLHSKVEASPTFEEDLENLLPEPEKPLPHEPPTPTETSPTFEEDLENLVPESKDSTPPPKPKMPLTPIEREPQKPQSIAKFPPAIEDTPKPLVPEPEDPVPTPKPIIRPTPIERKPQKPQPIARFSPAIEDKPKPLVPKPEDPAPPPTTTTVEMEPNQPQPEEVQQVDETLLTVIESKVQPKTETDHVTAEEVREVEPTPSPVIEDDVVKLLKSTEASERYEAVQNLARMHNEWTIDPLLYAAIDSDREVARLALEGLLEMRTAVKERILGLPQGFLTPLHLGGAAFISCLVGQPFVYIAPGPFLMGSDSTEDDPDDDPSEQPQHKLSLPGYWIACHPVTASHFQTFLNESGYQPTQGERDYGQADYPVADVTWNDALAYCLWLAQQTGLRVNLPSEAEWEKAARGTDGRCYPWGDQPPTTALYNPDKLTPVGQYSPQGDSPYGCADMAGNVWEWTRTVYEPYPYNPEDGRETLEGDKSRAIRGLAFNNPEKFARCTARYRLKPILHLRTLGFRVVISPT